jgi:hypothetical protein
MKITILGAAGGEVTGSAYYVQTKKASSPSDLEKNFRSRILLPAPAAHTKSTLLSLA